MSKSVVFDDVQKMLDSFSITTVKIDDDRPWGGFFVIDESDVEKFVDAFFSNLYKTELLQSNKLSPKILIVAPNKRLSWQYHHRRAEIWKLIKGKALVVTSDNDDENETVKLNIGDVVQLSKGQRHRLVGDENEWGIVAEIWQHTDADNPSDENDIIRLQDDFGRN